MCKGIIPCAAGKQLQQPVLWGLQDVSGSLVIAGEAR